MQQMFVPLHTHMPPAYRWGRHSMSRHDPLVALALHWLHPGGILGQLSLDVHVLSLTACGPLEFKGGY